MGLSLERFPTLSIYIYIYERDEKHNFSLCLYLFSPMPLILGCTDNEIISICKLDQMSDLNTLGMTS